MMMRLGCEGCEWPPVDFNYCDDDDFALVALVAMMMSLGCEGCEWPPGPGLGSRLTRPGITFTSRVGRETKHLSSYER